jgi:hypothetical protein
MRFMGCAHATTLDLASMGRAGPGPREDSEDAVLLQKQGDAHEAAHLERLKADGRMVVEIERGQLARDSAVTRAILAEGPEVVFQGAFLSGNWGGWSDSRRLVLRTSAALRHILHEKLPVDPLAVHHIFPKKFMQDFDFPIERLNTASNYAILSQADNAELGDRDPFDVWRTLKMNQRECASQQLFFVGKDDLLRREAYEEFIDFRAEKIAEKLNEFLELGTT